MYKESFLEEKDPHTPENPETEKTMNNTLLPEQSKALDYFKLFAAFLVIAIHTSPLAGINATADFVLTRILARIAVPFFLMVSGFFLLPQYLFDKSADSRRLCTFLKKTFLLYLLAVLLYLPVNFYAGHFRDAGIWDILRMLLFDGTFYHLWYLPAAMLGTSMVFLLGKKLPFHAVFGICIFLYLLGLLGDSYYGFVAAIPALKSLYDALFVVFSYTRNGIFYAPVFLVMGAALSPKAFNYLFYSGLPKHQFPVTDDIRTPFSTAGTPDVAPWLYAKRQRIQRQYAKRQYAVGFFACLSVMTAEGLLLHHFDMQRHDSMYLALPPCMYFLFRWILAANCGSDTPLLPSAKSLHFHKVLRLCKTLRITKKLRTISACIYLLHPLFIILVRGFAKVIGIESVLIDNSILHYIAVCLSTCAVSLCLERLPHIFRFFGILPPDRQIKGQKEESETDQNHILQKGRAWIEVDSKNLRQNVHSLQSLLPPDCKLMPAVKANAYGHGAVLVSKELNSMGIQSFCVATVSEGMELRKNGIYGEILVLGYTHPAQFPLLKKYRLTQTVVDYNYAQILNQYGKKLKVHIKIDTGMHRLGERCEETEKIKEIFSMKNLVTEGIYTHLCADTACLSSDKAFTAQQVQAFYDIVGRLKEDGIRNLKVHMLASSGLLHYPELAGNYARVGIALYGCLSSRKDLKNCPVSLLPVLSVKARVELVKTLKRGESAGYGMQYTAEKDSQIAVIAIGYGDGLPRILSQGRGKMLVNGCEAPIIGRICMDQTIVDITDIPDVKAGDMAVIIGRSGEHEITAYDMAEASETITNEILSRLGLRLERILT